ncbi:MAG: hypothetical protein JWQ64_2589 [Subtercola sp.]|nr:hypothetical protein [Subtercola sp.]
MRRRATVVVCAGLGLIVVGAAALEGVPVFTGPRWVPDFSPPVRTAPPLPQNGGPVATAPALPAQAAGSGFPLGTVLLWVGIAAAVVIIALLVRRWLRLRRSRPQFGLRDVGMLAADNPVLRAVPDAEPEAEPLRRGIEEALRQLDEQRAPADAVMRAWLGLQQTAEESGISRRSAETPTEFTARIMAGVFTDDRAVQTLLKLYLRTRFGDHPVTAADVERAREALEGLASTWNDSSPKPGRLR